MEAQKVDQLEALQKDAEAAKRESDRAAAEAAKKQKEAADKQRDVLIASRKKANAEAKSRETTRNIPVLVQTRKNQPVRIMGRVWVESLTPTMVNRQELRKLQNLMQRRKIQLIVGEQGKPADVTVGRRGEVTK